MCAIEFIAFCSLRNTSGKVSCLAWKIKWLQKTRKLTGPTRWCASVTNAIAYDSYTHYINPGQHPGPTTKWASRRGEAPRPKSLQPPEAAIFMVGLDQWTDDKRTGDDVLTSFHPISPHKNGRQRETTKIGISTRRMIRHVNVVVYAERLRLNKQTY